MSDTPILPNTEPATFSVGLVLRTRREAQGLTLEYIAEKLKLSMRQLAALESDDFNSLPGNTFVRGFVRNYARFIGIDPQPLLDHLSIVLPQERVQVAMPRVSDATALNTVLRAGAEGRQWLVWLMVLFGLSLGAGAVFWYLQQPAAPVVAIKAETTQVELSAPVLVGSGVGTERTSEPDSVPVILSPASSPVVNEAASVVKFVPVASASAPLAITSVLAASRPMPEKVAINNASTATTASMIKVSVEFDSWVQIVDADNHKLISELLAPGSERSLSGKPPFKVRIGNAPKTKLYYRGKQVDLAPFAKADVATLELK